MRTRHVLIAYTAGIVTGLASVTLLYIALLRIPVWYLLDIFYLGIFFVGSIAVLALAVSFRVTVSTVYKIAKKLKT